MSHDEPAAADFRRKAKIACVAVARDEGASIAEWIAFQIAIGFDTVIVYDNLSTDDTAEIAGRFSRIHDVRLIHWPDVTSDFQRLAYSDALTTFGNEFSWIAFFDTDEFLILDGYVQLPELLRDDLAASAICVSWAMFGSSGLDARSEGLTINAFLRRSPASFGPNLHVKSIVRPSRVTDQNGVHSFKVNGDYFDLGGRNLGPGSDLLAATPDYLGGKLNHYFTKSKREWRHKIEHRGYRDITRSDSEFNAYDRNEVFDDSAIHYAPQVLELMARTTTFPSRAL